MIDKKQIERDIYYLKLAKIASSRTKCLSRKVGAILTKDDCLIGEGFNGPPKGIKHCNERSPRFYFNIDGKEPENFDINSWDFNKCPRQNLGYKSGEGLFLCSSGHAERNALILAAKNGISTLGTTLYCYCSLPCLPCIIEIINAGVKRLVYFKGDDYNKYSRVLLVESGIEYTEYEHDKIFNED